MAVIELDRVAPTPPSSSRPPLRILRPIALVLAVVLTLACAAATPVRSVLWQDRGGIPIDVTGSFDFVASGDRLYLVERPDAGAYRISAWSAGRADLLWEVPAPPLPPLRGDVPANGVEITVTGEDLLIDLPGWTTLALDPETGDTRWLAPTLVQSSGGGLGVRTETRFRPGTEYDPASGDAGALYWSADGLPYTEPPQHTVVYGMDLRSGERLWANDEPGSVRVLPVRGDDGSVVVAASGKLVRRELRTGAVLHEATLPAARDTLWVEALGDVLIVRRGTWDRGATLTAYAADTLTRLWEISEPAYLNSEGACYDLPCGADQHGLNVLDPRTGQKLWQVGRDTDVHAWGGSAVEVSSLGSGRVGRHDRGTGRSRDLGVVEEVEVEPGLPLVLRRSGDAARSTFSVLAPGRDEPQPLGTATDVAGPCQASAQVVACVAGGGIKVWAYRA